MSPDRHAFTRLGSPTRSRRDDEQEHPYAALRLACLVRGTDDSAEFGVELPEMSVAADIQRRVAGRSLSRLGAHLADRGTTGPDSTRHAHHDDYNDHDRASWLSEYRGQDP